MSEPVGGILASYELKEEKEEVFFQNSRCENLNCNLFWLEKM